MTVVSLNETSNNKKAVSTDIMLSFLNTEPVIEIFIVAVCQTSSQGKSFY